jgi:ABC-2 type transport system ATP-binding protein
VLELCDLSKRYGDVQALDGVDVTVGPGSLVGFLGPNGAGKTTAMRSIFGLVNLDGGSVRWNGARVGADTRLGFGYMPEARGLYPSMRVGEQLTYLGRLHGMAASDAKDAAGHLLDDFGLGDRIGDKLETLSHGNQQRVQLAAALVHGPELLVLDEPFSGLDPIGVGSMEDVLLRRAADGAAVLFSSHQLDLVANLCDEVVIINEGRVALSGSLDAIRAASTRRRVEVGVIGGDWEPDLPGVVVARRNGDRVHLRVAHDVDIEELLRSAGRACEVTSFTFEPPSLSDLFREAVGL